MKKQVALIAALSMVLGIQVTAKGNDFSNHWAQEVITEWSQYGIVSGYEDGSFKPNNSMTRAEFAVVLSNVFGLVDTKSDNAFEDVKLGAWYADAVSKVAAAGIMEGANGKFAPSATITRQEVAVALVNAYNLTETGSQSVSFTDSASIANWAVEQVKIMASQGYISGRASGEFDPKANITRAEVLKMFDNMTAALFNKAGTYTQDAKGNVIINTQDVVLKDMAVAGDLYLAQGINLGEATLENVTVEGNTFVAGGGVNSIHFNNVTAKKPIHVKTSKAVRLVSDKNKIAARIESGQDVVLTGQFSEVVVSAGSTLELKGATVDKITVEPSGSEVGTLTMDDTSTVEEITANAAVNITGTGNINKLVANVVGVKSEIKPTTEAGKETADTPTTGGGGGGGNQVPGVDQDKDQEYIQISSIKVDDQEMLDKGISVSNAQIDIDIKKLVDNYGDDEIQGAAAKVTNLTAGTEITAAANLGPYTFSRSRTVTASGELLYTVADGSSFLAGKTNVIMGALKDAGLEDAATSVAQRLGYDSVNGLLGSRNSLNVKKLKDDLDSLMKMYADGEQDAVTIIDFLNRKGIAIDRNSFRYSVTVSAKGLVSRSYQVNVSF